jgi:hypothetical protein
MRVIGRGFNVLWVLAGSGAAANERDRNAVIFSFVRSWRLVVSDVDRRRLTLAFDNPVAATISAVLIPLVASKNRFSRSADSGIRGGGFGAGGAYSAWSRG